MQLGVNVPNFGPGTDPGVLRDWARITEGLGYDLLMVSDHVAVTPDVAERYPEPFYEPFTTLSWLAGVTTGVRLGTTVLILPYRHPLLVARMATNLHRLSGGRLVLGVGVGWARQEFAALGVPFAARGRLTDACLAALRDAWRAETEDGAAPIPVWVGGHSAAALRRAARYGDAWHPLRLSLARMRTILADHSLPAFAPRIALRLTGTPVDDPDRIAGVGTIEQILDDLDQLRLLGADTVVLDAYHGDPEEARRPHAAWRALTEVATHWRTAS
ncbi:alkanesulfonate monooxygenase SsuD/methylene tetrahydromethanopterin reductase-like flavin-dependent oxidoreductase (luciferase family) [Kitasatospora sp. MAA19]|uniref:LLM class flavin-dependent oxidoreductase n=1 Tax=Kitasatospora sp. MAA19 TaxID=3035090 RepID=UPI002476C969|nr:LLM class flavin-dependent oxidoreductase [Kitasatospora sp. MAA19]MDH6708772.1 alkanesulfonate monooxygenase SsuD/methylene tetrahydromethanopterin reductase-like flavin-dependent oxidoreductase (luciferase family) [Kitasatospora sp. MAA19]